MKHLRISLVMALVCVFTAVSSSQVTYARGGEDDNATGSTSNSQSNENTAPTIKSQERENKSNTRRASTEATKKPEVEREHATEIERHTNGQEDKDKLSKRDQVLADARKNAKEHSKEERQKNCQARQQNIQKRLTNAQSRAQRHLDTINGVLAKIESSNVDTSKISNYATLLAAAKQAQTQAASSVAALKAVNPTIDCTADKPVQSLADFKVALEQSRTDLKSYRASVKAILSQIESTANATTGTEQ